MYGLGDCLFVVVHMLDHFVQEHDVEEVIRVGQCFGGGGH
jgi:hypothetical protein